MELAQALKGIERLSNRLPVEEINFIREHKDEAIPFLLEYVKNALKKGKSLGDEIRDAHCVAMYLLAEFRVKEAFPILIEYLELEAKTVDYLICDILTEGFPSILACVAVIDDIPQIKTVVENRNIYVFNQVSALSTLTALYVEGIYSRNEYFDYLGYLLNEFKDDYTEFLTYIVGACIDVYASDHFELIEEMYENGFVDPFYISHIEFRRIVKKYDEKTSLSKLKKRESLQLITDTLKSIGWWACFHETPHISKKAAEEVDSSNRYPILPVNPAPKIGRNDPCPCGSGKKYKKCCI